LGSTVGSACECSYGTHRRNICSGADLVIQGRYRTGLTSSGQGCCGKARDLAAVFRVQSLIGNDGVKVIGVARAAEIVANVLLPAVFAMATHQKAGKMVEVHLKNRAVELFSSYPKLAGNSVTNKAQIALGLSHTVPEDNNAQDQQGLIALYRELVRHGIKPRQPRLPGV